MATKTVANLAVIKHAGTSVHCSALLPRLSRMIGLPIPFFLKVGRRGIAAEYRSEGAVGRREVGRGRGDLSLRANLGKGCRRELLNLRLVPFR